MVPGAGSQAGRFLVAWASYGQDGDGFGVYARRYRADGTPDGVEFQVPTSGFADQYRPGAAADARGNYVVVWQSFSGALSVSGRRLSPSGFRGAAFQVNPVLSGQFGPGVAADGAGNFAIGWHSVGQDGSMSGVYAQRYGGLLPATLAVDAIATPTSDGNRVLEACEEVVLEPGWRNVTGAAQALSGALAELQGPPPVAYTITDAAAAYGPVPNGAVSACGTDCYRVSVACANPRPVVHWDATAWESLLPDAQGQVKQWRLHVGESFTDVPRGSAFYRFVETLLHAGVTAGCSGTEYCPAASTSREQMAVFVLVAKETPAYSPPACTTPMFGDVPPSSPFCRWIEELARRGVVSGCGGGNYCPAAAVTREEMAVFVAATFGLTLYGG